MQTTVTTDRDEPQGLVQSIRGIDQALRQNYAGFALDVVVPEVQRSLETIDVVLPEAAVTAYAQAISERADHELVVPA